jgi:hypothetical protein
MNRALLLWVVAIIGAGLAFAAMNDAYAQAADPKVAAMTPAAPANAAEARLQDITRFRERFLAADIAYSDEARAEAERRLDALKDRSGEVSPAYFELELSRIVALADNGHTAAFPWMRAARYNRVPLRLAAFGEDFYVIRAAPEHADLLGARLVAIDGRSIAEARTAARSLMGGVPHWRDRFANYLLESPEQLHALELATSSNSATYRFALSGGGVSERAITASPASADGDMNRDLYPAPIESEQGWRTALAPERAPWALQNPDERFRWRSAPEIDGLVIELRQNNNAEDITVAEALTQFLNAITEHEPRNLVLDMRMNSGGDLNTTRAFVQALPARIPGRIFVLTSPWTFSAAISTVGYLEQAAPDRVTIVGEPVGDRLEFFAEGGMTELPNSHLMVLAATERHDYATGCEGFADCHGSVARNPIRVASLQPDIAAPWTIGAYMAGRDPGMEAVAAALR